MTDLEINLVTDIKRTERFFLVVPPGFENLAVMELNEKIPGIEISSTEKGGVTVQAPLPLGLAFNHLLKLPTLVLLRIAEFKCRDLPKLFQKTSNIRWGQYLLGGRFTLSVSSSKSRLQNEKKIAGSVSEGIARHFIKQPPKKIDKESETVEPFEILVRFFDDVCTFSLNLSGEALYKRGYKGLHAVNSPANLAVAPIRENLAAALFYALWIETRGAEARGFDILIDPMCGSGTFLFEAQNFWQPVSTRKFAYQARKEWVAMTISTPISSGSHFQGESFLQLYGFDKNEKTLQLLREYLPHARVSVFDIFSDLPMPVNALQVQKKPAQAPRLAVICNPPYGQRLRLSEKPEVYYVKLIKKILAHNPVAVGVIIPKRYTALVPKRFANYYLCHDWPFENGGIPVHFRIYKK